MASAAAEAAARRRIVDLLEDLEGSSRLSARAKRRLQWAALAAHAGDSTSGHSGSELEDAEEARRAVGAALGKDCSMGEAVRALTQAPGGVSLAKRLRVVSRRRNQRAHPDGGLAQDIRMFFGSSGSSRSDVVEEASSVAGLDVAVWDATEELRADREFAIAPDEDADWYAADGDACGSWRCGSAGRSRCCAGGS